MFFLRLNFATAIEAIKAPAYFFLLDEKNVEKREGKISNGFFYCNPDLFFFLSIFDLSEKNEGPQNLKNSDASYVSHTSHIHFAYISHTSHSDAFQSVRHQSAGWLKNSKSKRC